MWNRSIAKLPHWGILKVRITPAVIAASLGSFFMSGRHRTEAADDTSTPLILPTSRTMKCAPTMAPAQLDQADALVTKAIQSYGTLSCRFGSTTSEAPFPTNPPQILYDEKTLKDFLNTLEIDDKSLNAFLIQIRSVASQPDLEIGNNHDACQIPEPMIKKHYGGQHSMFSKLRRLGVLATSQLLRNGDISYETMVKLLKFHRQMIARCQNSDNYQQFGAPLPPGDIMVTRFDKQFPESAEVFLQNRKNFLPCDPDQRKTCLDTLPKDPWDFDPILAKNELSTKPQLHTKKIVLKTDTGEHIPLSYITWRSTDNEPLPDTLNVIHGKAMPHQNELDILEETYEDALKTYFQILKKDRPEDNHTSREILMDSIGMVAYLDCHLTDIIRGGGALPEMIADTLLHTADMPFITDCEGYTIWGRSMAFPNQNEFLKDFKAHLVRHLEVN